MSDLQAARERQKKHCAAIDGAKTTEAFAASPYFIQGQGSYWRWDEMAIATDRNFIVRNDLATALTPEEVERLILLVGEAIYDGERGRECSSNIEPDREILRKLEQMK